SVAFQDGNQIKFRPGVVTFVNTDERLTFDPSQKAIDAIQKGDVNAFNGELRNFVDVKMFDQDKVARQELKGLVRAAFPHWWQGIKRYHIRQDVQTMTGIRNWTFFENKRTALHEKKTEIQNKVVQKVVDGALPEDSKSGKFVECLFGLTTCKASVDPANPENR